MHIRNRLTVCASAFLTFLFTVAFSFAFAAGESEIGSITSSADGTRPCRTTVAETNPQLQQLFRDAYYVERVGPMLTRFEVRDGTEYKITTQKFHLYDQFGNLNAVSLNCNAICTTYGGQGCSATGCMPDAGGGCSACTCSAQTKVACSDCNCAAQ